MNSASNSNASDRENLFHTAYGVRLSKDAPERIFKDAKHSSSRCGQAIELVHEVIDIIAYQSEDVRYGSVVKLLSNSIRQRKKIEGWLTELVDDHCFRADIVGVMNISLDCMYKSPKTDK